MGPVQDTEILTTPFQRSICQNHLERLYQQTRYCITGGSRTPLTVGLHTALLSPPLPSIRVTDIPVCDGPRNLLVQQGDDFLWDGAKCTMVGNFAIG